MKQILFIALVLMCFIVGAQEKEIYCIQGQFADTQMEMSNYSFYNDEYPTVIANQEIKYGVRLVKVNNHTLLPIDTLVHTAFMTPSVFDTIRNKTKMIRIYHDLKMFRVMYDKYDPDTTYFIEGSFSNGMELTKFKLSDNVAVNYYDLKMNSKPYFIYETYKDQKMQLNYLNVKEKFLAKGNSDLLNFYYSEGYNGLGLDDINSTNWLKYTELLKLKRRLVDHDTIIGVEGYDSTFSIPDYNQLVKLEPELQKISSENGYIPFRINTDSVIVIYYKGRMKGDVYSRDHFIYNKGTGQWKYVTLPTAAQTIRAYGKWLAGCECFWLSAGRNKLVENNVEIPGKKYRRQDTTIWGMSADVRFEIQEIFPTGRLFIYNIDSGNYIDWFCLEHGEPQADSEILLIQDNSIYYRVNSSLYKREIINGHKLGDRKLLIEDETIPYVHWMFLSDSYTD